MFSHTSYIPHKGHIVGIETVDKMTDRLIAAKVREHFRV